MTATTGSATKSAALAEASGLSVEEVDANLAAGLLFYRESNYFGGEQPPGEWLDSTGTEYVVAGGGYYGRGNTVEAAKANFRKYGGRLMNGYVVLTFGPGSIFLGIGGMGWSYLGEAPAVREVEPKGSKR